MMDVRETGARDTIGDKVADTKIVVLLPVHQQGRSRLYCGPLPCLGFILHKTGSVGGSLLGRESCRYVSPSSALDRSSISHDVSSCVELIKNR